MGVTSNRRKEEVERRLLLEKERREDKEERETGIRKRWIQITTGIRKAGEEGGEGAGEDSLREDLEVREGDSEEEDSDLQVRRDKRSGRGP